MSMAAETLTPRSIISDRRLCFMGPAGSEPSLYQISQSPMPLSHME